MNKENKTIRRDNIIEIEKKRRNLMRDFFDDFFLPFGGENLMTDHFHSELYEDEANYHIKAELPGMSRDKIKVELENNQLRVHAEKEEEKEFNKKRYHFSEISYGSFSRTFSFPNKIKSDNIKASYKSGVLTIIVPKSTENKAQKINIE